jgi:hypothetical protein
MAAAAVRRLLRGASSTSVSNTSRLLSSTSPPTHQSPNTNSPVAFD